MSDLLDAVASLRREWRLDFVRVRRVLAALVDTCSISELVAASGLPRRDVESVLAALAPFLKTDGDHHRLPGAVELPGAGGGPEPGGPVPMAERTGSADDGGDLARRMAELAAGLPPSRWRLDHVPATAETMARRALYLTRHYALDGASVLCLGDHDLTSLAVGSAEPGAEITVVDIDEPILDHVSDSAAQLGLPLTAAWADLRLAFPPSLVGTADLVFTDPPYTTEGMRLFLVRALEALRPTGHERVAFCFGTGERHLVKALEVQALLGDLRLALEAMLPGFNRYAGAEAIGSRSDLYICRPTKGA
ncbi:MAG TPA: bis-aminopropyl spermidine synthase family protein, partial [Acidimicrobiia bacterium]|nr:bis-aminopropyl spermidine synthase family protein [Acidimicrobiia bacterium]